VTCFVNKSDGGLAPWMDFFKAMILKPVPRKYSEFTEDIIMVKKLDKSPYWKLKEEVSRIVFNFYNKWGVKEHVDRFEEGLCDYLVNDHLKDFAEAFGRVLSSRPEQFVGTKTLNNAIKFLSHCVKIDGGMKIMQPFVEKILKRSTIPNLLVTPEEA
jgi:hypothetical protein